MGRGCLAGPVVAATVVFPPSLFIPGVDDSKKLTPKRREELYTVICQEALSYHVAFVEVSEIDRLNILQASLLAMRQAVEGLHIPPEFLLIDGRYPIKSSIPQKAICGGDGLSHSIAAASIVAKVSRDRWMVEAEERYPGFSFARHKGYGTPQHLQELAVHGPTDLHRRSFEPVRQFL